MPRVLLVDDEPGILTSFRRVLRHEPYEIALAPSGEVALEILASQKIDVIVSDQRMPGMSGAELLDRVRRLHPDTVRIVLSGEPIDLGLSDPSAYFRVLCKPTRIDELKSVIAQALHAHV
jgi:CheY-like chemotaxis protein